MKHVGYEGSIFHPREILTGKVFAADLKPLDRIRLMGGTWTVQSVESNDDGDTDDLVRVTLSGSETTTSRTEWITLGTNRWNTYNKITN